MAASMSTTPSPLSTDFSCKYQCSEYWVPIKPCQCFSKCFDYDSCCPDFVDHCEGMAGIEEQEKEALAAVAAFSVFYSIIMFVLLLVVLIWAFYSLYSHCKKSGGRSYESGVILRDNNIMISLSYIGMTLYVLSLFCYLVSNGSLGVQYNSHNDIYGNSQIASIIFWFLGHTLFYILFMFKLYYFMKDTTYNLNGERSGGDEIHDLIDYLIHQLYYLSDDDIDFFIPQLFTLLISPSEEISKQLECFILHKCMKSIDFAIKCFWNLHAIQFYSKLEQHKNRCDEMRQNLEMIVVNGQLPRNLFTQLPRNLFTQLPNDIQKELINDQQKEEKDIQQQQQNGHNNSNNNNKLLNGNKPPLLSSALPQPKKPNNIKKVNDPLLNGATEYLKKQRRCTYFNAELDFAHFLEGVSSALEQ